MASVDLQKLLSEPSLGSAHVNPPYPKGGGGTPVQEDSEDGASKDVAGRSAARRLGDAVLVATFLVVVMLPAWGLTRTGIDAEIERTERRPAAAFPRFEYRPGRVIPRRHSLEQFPRGFEAWFNDRVGFRRELIQVYNLAKIAGLTSAGLGRLSVGQSGDSPVIIGRDGWLFYAGEHLVDDYRRTRPFRREELDRWKALLTARRDWLRARGIRYLVVVAPNAQTIYPEFMPRSMNRVGPQSRLDQLLEHLRGPDAIEIVDLRRPLREANSVCRTYHRTDTHWNDFGAFVAYREVLERLRTWFPELRPRALEDFEILRRDAPGYYLATLVDSPIPYREELITLTPRRPRQAVMEPMDEAEAGRCRRVSENLAGEGRRAVVLHDSFMMALAPYLGEHWRHMHYAWTYDFPADLIERDPPDVVIHEFVERRLMTQPPDNPPEWDAASSPDGRH